MLNFITDKLAERRAYRQQQQRDREEAAIRHECLRIMGDLERVAHLMFAKYVRQCREDEREFVVEEEMDGACLRLKNFYNRRKKEWETEVWASYPDTDIVHATFSPKAVCRHIERVPRLQPL